MFKKIFYRPSFVNFTPAGPNYEIREGEKLTPLKNSIVF